MGSVYSGHDRIETRISDLNARVYFGPRNVATVVLENVTILHMARRRLLNPPARRVWVEISRTRGGI